MLSLLLANILNSKCFDNKQEGDVIDGVFPERGSSGHWVVAEFGKVELEYVVGNFSGLFQARDAL